MTTSDHREALPQHEPASSSTPSEAPEPSLSVSDPAHITPAHTKNARRERARRWFAQLGLLVYTLASLWCLERAWYEDYERIMHPAWVLLVIAALVSVASYRQHKHKMAYVEGTEQVDQLTETGELPPTWVARLGDKGGLLMNALAFSMHIPILLSLTFYYDWRVFGLERFTIFSLSGSSLLEESVGIGHWVYFVFSQFLPLNGLLSYVSELWEPISKWTELDQALANALSPFGEVVMFGANLAISLLLIDGFLRRKQLKETLERHISAIELSAQELCEHEQRHLTLFAPRDLEALSRAERAQLEVELRAAQDLQRELSHDLLSKQRLMLKFLGVFSKAYLHRQLKRALQDNTHDGAQRAAVLEALTLDGSKLNAAFRAFAKRALEADQPAPMRRLALLTAHLWAKPTQRAFVLQQASELASLSSAHCASVESGLDYERLTLAATKALISQGELSALSAMIGGLQSPSVLLRQESKQLFDGLIEVIAMSAEGEERLSVRETLKLTSTLLEAFERASEGDGVELTKHIQKLKEHLTQRYLEGALRQPLISFICDLLLSVIGDKLTRPSQLSESFKLFALSKLETLAVELWAILSERPLSDALSRELFEGVQQRPQLSEAFTHVLKHVLREGTYRERLRAARLFGAAPYDKATHQALLDELTAWLEVGEHGEGTSDVLFELICALGRLCQRAPEPALAQQSSDALSKPISFAALSEAQNLRLEVARRYALSFLTPTDAFLSIFEWGLNREALISPALISPALTQSAPTSYTLHELTEDERRLCVAPAFELLLVEQPSFELIFKQTPTLKAQAEGAEELSLNEDSYEQLVKLFGYNLETAKQKELPTEGAQLGVLWLNAIANLTKKRPSATGLLLTLSMLDPAYPTAVRQAALRKLKQYSAFLKTSDLGPLSHRSVAEWVTLRALTLLEADKEPLHSSLLLTLGTFTCEASTALLWETLQNTKLTVAMRGQAAKAIGYRKSSKDIMRLCEVYDGSTKLGVKEPIVTALTQMNSSEANEALIKRVREALSTDSFGLNSASLQRATAHLSKLNRLELMRPLYERFSAQDTALQAELVKAYHVNSFGTLELQGELLKSAVELLAQDTPLKGAHLQLTRAITKALPSMRARLYELLEAHAEGALEGVWDEAVDERLMALLQERASTSQLSPIVRGEFASALVSIKPDEGLTWVEERLQSAPLQERSQLIAALAPVHSARFVELASDHIGHYLHRVGEQGGFSPSCVNRLAYPYLERAGRAAIPHLRKLAEDRNHTYSITVVNAVRTFGDALSDRPWVDDLYQAVRFERQEEGKLYGGLEVALLNALHGFGDVKAFPALVDLALMETTNASEDKLQAQAIKLLEGLELEEIIFARRDEA